MNTDPASTQPGKTMRCVECDHSLLFFFFTLIGPFIILMVLFLRVFRIFNVLEEWSEGRGRRNATQDINDKWGLDLGGFKLRLVRVCFTC